MKIDIIKQEYNHPMIGKSLDDYREELGINLGMSKEEALEKFGDWQEEKKTCQRCGGEEYIEFCPFHLICEERSKGAEEERDERRDVERDGNRRRVVEADGVERIRVSVSEERKRSPLR